MRPSRLLLPATLVAVVALVVLLLGRAEDQHQIAFDVDYAGGLLPGLKVRAAGQPVGRIERVTTVDGGHRARVVIGLTDDRVWPLPRDTRVAVRFGGTVAAASRFIDLEVGTASGSPLRNGAVLTADRVAIPVEVDQVLDTFDAATRRDLRSSLDAAGTALPSAATPLRRALDTAPGAVSALQGVFGDLAARQSSLEGLVTTTSRVLERVNAAEPDLQSLLQDASTTLRTVGSRAAGLRTTLGQLPATLASTRTTLRRADGSLDVVRALATRLRPGIDRVIDVTPTLSGALTAVRDVAPDATRALGTTRDALPSIDELLRQTTSVLPDVDRALGDAAVQLGCIRPYAPEIAGFASTWSSFVANGDKKDKYARLYYGTYPFPNSWPLSVPQTAKLVPSAFSSWGFPRAPGANVDQPWYQPQCGVTADGADPQKAPEARDFDLFSKQLITQTPPIGDGSGAP